MQGCPHRHRGGLAVGCHVAARKIEAALRRYILDHQTRTTPPVQRNKPEEHPHAQRGMYPAACKRLGRGRSGGPSVRHQSQGGGEGLARGGAGAAPIPPQRCYHAPEVPREAPFHRAAAASHPRSRRLRPARGPTFERIRAIPTNTHERTHRKPATPERLVAPKYETRVKTPS